MDDRQVVIDNPMTLVMWLRFNQPKHGMTESEAQILLNYMEGHDYAIVVKGEQMFRKDIAEDQGEIETYDIDDVIDIVCEWNYELLIDVKAGMEHPKDFIDYCNYSDAYDALKEDEPVLARLFEQTRYGKAVQDLVDKVIAKSSIAEMPDMEYVVRTPKTLAVGENTPLKEYEQEKVR